MRNGFYASDHSFWRTALLLGVLILIGSRYAFQLYLDHKLDLAQTEWEVEIEKARTLAHAAQERLASLKSTEIARDDEKRLRDFELIRAEAHRSHVQYQEFLAQTAHNKELSAQQAMLEKERAQHAAAIDSRNQIAAMQRALAIPIQRH